MYSVLCVYGVCVGGGYVANTFGNVYAMIFELNSMVCVDMLIM